MKRSVFLFLLGWGIAHASCTYANEPDSVFMMAYSANPTAGLSFAYSVNGQTWSPIGQGRAFVKSDYGTWGAEKRMFNPDIARCADGSWIAVWGVNERANQFAVALTPDLLHWKPQDYPYMQGVGQCLEPVVNVVDSHFVVRFHDASGQWYQTQSADGFHFSEPVKTSAPQQERIEAEVQGRQVKCSVVRVSWREVEMLNFYDSAVRVRDARHAESMADDATRFSGLREVSAQITVQPEKAKTISDKLIGIFFEDINYSADGGLYAELIQNRDFEYSSADGGREPDWSPTNSWSLSGQGATFSIVTDEPVHPNQMHYAVLDVATPGAGLTNDGFDGIVIRKGERYDISLFARQLTGTASRIRVQLNDGGKVIGETVLKSPTSKWSKLSGVIKADADATHATLSVIPTKAGRVALDLISLFPQRTFKGRKNGLRADLAQALSDLHPKFMRFPGGCVAHGDGLGNMYNWKESIGPIETRKGARNIWGYHQSRGLGYYEFFQMCEDMGMEPLPILPAGVPCQNSSRGGAGQQGGIPMAQMNAYVQDVLDLIEWANGDPKTSQWARKRAEAGHPKPFGLHYIGIGNEDLISETFTERYLMIIKAVKEKYPEIQVCGTVGPFYEGSDYEQGWRLAKDNHIDMVDEHYYVSPGWFVHNQDFYDNYDRSASKVYLGEYASHTNGRVLNMETALTCALHICNLERNGDIVSMSSYAPLLAKEGHTQWNPDLIYFDNERVHLTTDYYTQLMHGQHSGNQYVPTSVNVQTGPNHRQAPEAVSLRLTTSVVRDTITGRTHIKMVNILPQAVQAQVTYPGLQSGTASVVVLKGDGWADRNAVPATAQMPVSESFTYEVPPYSFVIISI